MCGIVGVISRTPVNQLIYDALLLLQHRGQDAAGIVTMQGTQVLHAQGARHGADVFRTRNMRALPGHCGVWARCATPPRAMPTAKKRRSRST
jgi:amidophosphoribosyltransferase